jgi:hypothetical protein
MATQKRKVRCFVFLNGSLSEFDTVDEGLEFAGGELSADLVQVIDEGCTVVIAETAGDLTADQATAFAQVPSQHRPGMVAVGLALVQTFSSRDPVLVINAGVHFVQVVAPALRLEQFVWGRYGRQLSLLESPPSPAGRWVVSIAENGELMRFENVIGIRPGIGQA